MKFISYLLSLTIFFQACSTTKKRLVYQSEPEPSRSPAALPGNLIINTNIIPLAPKNLNIQLSSQLNTVQICGRTFSEIQWQSNDNNTKVGYKKMALPGNKLGYFIPNRIEVVDLAKASTVNQLTVSPISRQITHPPIPDIPITKEGLTPELCKTIQDYHNRYTLSGAKTISTPVDIATRSFTELKTQQTVYSALQSESKIPSTGSHFKGVIFYDSIYEDEALDLKQAHDQKGIPTIAIAIEDLPGYDAQDVTPLDCYGDFYKECYHSWSDPILGGNSPRSIPGLKGYHRQTKVYETYQRVSYIPGLIRAETRRLLKSHPIQGIILLGSDEVIAPYHITTAKHGHYDYYDGPNFMKAMLHTDIFYMMPTLPLVISPKLDHVPVSGMLWSCQNPQGQIKLKYFCNDDEVRFWPTPALTAYKWAPYSPSSRIFSPKYGFQNNFYQTLPVNQMIGVGRIPTQEKILGFKDPWIERYVDKFTNWMTNPPALSTTKSIMSNGGSTSDTWIFLAEDVNAFTTTYGAQGKKYASEFFVPLAKCAGCTYKSGPDIMQEFTQTPRMISLVMNGHGGHVGLQAPYANPNVPSGYNTEDFWSYGGDHIRLRHQYFPQDNTLIQWEDTNSLVGHVIANSCDLSDFNMNNESFKFILNDRPQANERSFAENLLLLRDAGAVTTYLNSDVGWGGSDNQYNARLMNHVKNTYQNCGNFGDAVKMMVLDVFKTPGLGWQFDWQVYNRQFLGSPFTLIAKKPTACYITNNPSNGNTL